MIPTETTGDPVYIARAEKQVQDCFRTIVTAGLKGHTKATLAINETVDNNAPAYESWVTRSAGRIHKTAMRTGLTMLTVVMPQ
jgi:hypothetical protein